MFYLHRRFRNTLTAAALAAACFCVLSIPTNAQTITHFPMYTLVVDGTDAPVIVSGTGDVNNDGFDDFIVGAPESGSIDVLGNGSATVFSGQDGSILFSFFGGNAFDSFGNSVSDAGDVNGDGFADVIVAAIDEGNGTVRVFSGADGSTLFTFFGDSTLDSFGNSVSGAGDVNGDGFSDLIVGVPDDINLGNFSGSARVLSGADGSILFNFEGDSFFDGFGASVSGAGDVNGDGFADVIVGAPDDDNNGGRSGSARVLSGSDGSELFTFNGDDGGVMFGTSVSGAGDVNGDGFDDLIVGDLEDSARVFSGFDGSELHTFVEKSEDERFGVSVSGTGDVNGDGFADLIIGATDIFGANGIVRVFSGIDAEPLAILKNPFAFGSDFGSSVSGVGDINGDGVDDYIIGGNGGFARVLASQIMNSPPMLGDINRDQVVNFLDIAPFVAVLSIGAFQDEADIDRNLIVNFLDVAPFISILSGP